MFARKKKMDRHHQKHIKDVHYGSLERTNHLMLLIYKQIILTKNGSGVNNLFDVAFVRRTRVEWWQDGNGLKSNDEDGIEQNRDEHVFMETNPVDIQLPVGI